MPLVPVAVVPVGLVVPVAVVPVGLVTTGATVVPVPVPAAGAEFFDYSSLTSKTRSEFGGMLAPEPAAP